MKRIIILAAALVMLTACGPNEDQQALTRFNDGVAACHQQNPLAGPFINCEYDQYAILFTEQHLQYQDVLTQWRSEMLAIISDHDQDKIPESVTTALIQQSESRFVHAIQERRHEGAEAAAQPPPILTLLDAVGTTRETIHCATKKHRNDDDCQEQYDDNNQ